MRTKTKNGTRTKEKCEMERKTANTNKKKQLISNINKKGQPKFVILKYQDRQADT